MSSWTKAVGVVVPSWVFERQDEFQSRKYSDSTSRMEFVLNCAMLNGKLTGSAPLAAAIFSTAGSLISIGVDAPGIGGHEMTNALVLGSNILGSQEMRARSDWELFSLAPPCLVCLGNIYSEKPGRFVCAVTHADLLRFLNLPNTPMPSSNWKRKLEQRGVKVEDGVARDGGTGVLGDFRSRGAA